MEKLVNTVTNSMLGHGIISTEDQDIYKFGIECVILKVIHYISYLTIAMVMKEPFALIIMACTFFPLRKSVGGYHAKTRIGCYIVSCLTVFAGLWFYKQEFSSKVYLICWIISSFTIFIFAPLDNENKRMGELELRYYRKKARIIISLMGALAGIAWACGIENISRMLICGITVSANAIIVGKMNAVRNYYQY